ncbi:MAG: DNRLRE domain-containing protein [Planctomycetota bacterium]
MRFRMALLSSALLIGARAHADMVDLHPSKDNTLIQQSNPMNQLSNGQGDIFVGRTNQDGQGIATISIRRGLIAFDIASVIPAGSIIQSVSLTLRDVMGLNGDPTVRLHRVSKDWGEGSSFFSGGVGAPAASGDATWLYTYYNSLDPTASSAWATPGGDYSSTVSASAVIYDDLGGGQLFTWSSAIDQQMLFDVQDWLDIPGSNFGWILLGDESRGQTAKRLNSGESATPPLLSITYTTAVPEASTLFLSASGLLVLSLGRLRQKFALKSIDSP